MKKIFFAVFFVNFLALNALASELSSEKATLNAKNSQNSTAKPKKNSQKPTANSQAKATSKDLNISKGQALILEFKKQGLKDIKSHTNLLKSPKSQAHFEHPSDSNKVVIVFSSAYKKPIASADIKAFYADKSTMKYHLLGVEGTYASESLSVEPSKVSPPKSELKRIVAELKEANAVYATLTAESLYDGEFELPLQTPITSHFGTARIFNGELKSYHSGTDFRAAVGTPVLAANAGIVRLAKHRYYAGGSVVIDHGHGIFTQYYHLSELKVAVGERVKKGQIIALSGDTGRVTGAHLHFGVFAGGTQVEPLDFIEKFNALFKP